MRYECTVPVKYYKLNMSPIILAVLVVGYTYRATGQSLCTTPTGASGTCKSLYECDTLLALVTNKERTPLDLFTLKRSQCGFKDNKPLVCCPEPCTTPEGLTGECINIFQCDYLTNKLRQPVTAQNKKLVMDSKCTSEDNYGVCCPLPVIGNCEQRISASPPDPRSQCCGIDGVVGNKIVGGTATTVDQYPWLALIDYIKDGRLKMLCGAALISGKYVLTAGHCVIGEVLDFGTPTYVRLGEYDTGNEGPDCVRVEAGGTDCTTGALTIAIEQTIPHPEFNPINPLRRNDIALIRMVDMAPYTDFIRPICLPSVDYTLLPPEKFALYAAGWGAVNTTLPKSKIKLHVKLPYIPSEVCQPIYTSRRTPLWENQVCAGGEAGKDSCKGDSGGPLMFENGRSFEAVGVVSFGPLPCGIEDIPGVYSNVFKYKEWIKKTIRP